MNQCTVTIYYHTGKPVVKQLSEAEAQKWEESALTDREISYVHVKVN